jgi:hypothetical protein
MTTSFKSGFGCHSTPFTRKIATNQLHDFSFFHEARDNTTRAIEKRMSGQQTPLEPPPSMRRQPN